MTISPETNSTTTRIREESSEELVPLDLLTDLATLLEQEKIVPVAGPSPVPNAPARLRAEIAAAPKSMSSSPEAQPQPPSVVRQRPRLERVPTAAIRPAASLLRQRLASTDFAALTASIARNGLAQPLFVRILSNEPTQYELFAGYLRWRAALAAKVDSVPVIVFEHLNDVIALELNLLENLNRRDLTIIEQAQAFRILVERYGRTPEQIAALTGRSRNQITNMLCLVALPEEVRLRLRKGQISFEHGRVLVGTPDPTSLARRVVAERLTVRETELLAAQHRMTAVRTDETRTQSEESQSRSAESALGLTTDPTDISPRNDLRVLRAALRVAIGAEFEISIDRNGSVLLIGGGSAQETANIVSTLCEALRLLRMNRAISATSQEFRTS